MMSGLPGTGKSTVARRIVESMDADIKIIATDIVRKELYQPPTYADEENAAVHHEVQRRLIANLHQGAIVIYDATNLVAQYRNWVDFAQSETGCRLLIVQTVADEALVRERLIARQQADTSASDADYEIYLMMKESMEPIARPHLTIRTDTHYESDFARVIDAIGAEINRDATQ